MTRPMPTVILAGEVPFLRSLIRLALEDEGFSVVDECTTIEEVLVSAHRHHPDVVLLDLGEDEVSTVRLIEDLLDVDIHMAIIAVSDVDATHGEKLFAAGATAYLQKPFSMYDLVDTIRKVAPVFK
ncbi:MAG: response regulator [Candidatus Thorarchaeota archaeon]|nr:response regulator [Candidatus Thorarchaeota archaeon]